MSDNIYFNRSKKFSLKRSFISATTQMHYLLAPDHAKKVARKLLLTPVRSAPKNALPTGLVKGEVQGRDGLLKTYRLGSGPVWILTHGWSGTASQFFL